MPSTHRLPVFLLAACLSCVGSAFAQSAETARGIRTDGDGQPYRPWDLTISTGLQTDRESRDWIPYQYDSNNWDGGWGLQVDVGRYWSSHLKTEFAGAVLTTREVHGFEVLQFNGVPGQVFWDGRGRRGYISGAVSWQFLHNSFAHPFVSAGVRGNVVTIDRNREGYGYTWNGTSSQAFTIPSINDQKTEWTARPYVGAGYKSYFYNDRTFIRSELQFGFASQGVSQWTLRTGFGWDF